MTKMVITVNLKKTNNAIVKERLFAIMARMTVIAKKATNQSMMKREKTTDVNQTVRL